MILFANLGLSNIRIKLGAKHESWGECFSVIRSHTVCKFSFRILIHIQILRGMIECQ